MATETVPNRSGVCSGCGRLFDPYPRRACVQRFCSASCRSKWWAARQRSLFPSCPVPPVVDQRVPRSDRCTLQRMSRAILERLREGPATATELQAMFPGARSVRTRISDVSLWLQRHERQCVAGKPLRGTVGEWIYSIEDKP